MQQPNTMLSALMAASWQSTCATDVSQNELTNSLMTRKALSNVVSFSFGSITKNMGNETQPTIAWMAYNVAIVFDAVLYVPSAKISTAVAAL